ncbi:MAG: tetratricopeptide (TPR) repeat protein [Myxococcota bacterium]|jgi:tetratricopeptide (TPR) repeat protein
MRKFPLLLLVLASCQSSSIDSGDTYFRQKSYLEAYHEYLKLDVDDAEVQQRIAVTRYFLAEDAVRRLSNSGYPERALETLKAITPSAPDSQVAVLEALAVRCQNHIATRHFDIALALNDLGNKKGAIRELLAALSWREDYAPAIERLAIITEREEMRDAQGKENYLEAIGHLEAGHNVRAYTSFMHASNLLTDPELAQNRLNAIGQTLAEESMRQAMIHIAAQQTGMAWVAIQDAIHLGIEDPLAIEIAERLNATLLSQAHLVSADIQVRAGKHRAADASLAAAAEYSVVEHTEQLIAIRNRNVDKHQQQRYMWARAYELDFQLQHAQKLYVEIFSASDGFGYKDAEARLANLDSRLHEAMLYYQQALLAQQNNDLDSCRENLRSVLQISIDYEDALYLFGQINNTDINEQ